MTVESTHTVYAKLENRPGTLERATRVLKERRINVEGFSLETVGTTGFMRMSVQKPREVVEALRSQGVEAYESQTLLMVLPNKPGELHRASSELAAAGINVESIFPTADGRLAMRTSDNERASQILRKM